MIWKIIVQTKGLSKLCFNLYCHRDCDNLKPTCWDQTDAVDRFKMYITTAYQFTQDITSSLDRIWFTYNPKWLEQLCSSAVDSVLATKNRAQ